MNIEIQTTEMKNHIKEIESMVTHMQHEILSFQEKYISPPKKDKNKAKLAFKIEEEKGTISSAYILIDENGNYVDGHVTVFQNETSKQKAIEDTLSAAIWMATEYLPSKYQIHTPHLRNTEEMRNKKNGKDLKEKTTSYLKDKNINKILSIMIKEKKNNKSWDKNYHKWNNVENILSIEALMKQEA